MTRTRRARRTRASRSRRARASVAALPAATPVDWQAPIDAHVIDWGAPIDPYARFAHLSRHGNGSRSRSMAMGALLICAALLAPHIGPDSVFSAGDPAARPEPAAAVTQPRQRGALAKDFMRIDTARGHLVVEVALPPESIQELASAIDRDIAALERSFGQVFATRPVVYVAASRASFGTVLREAFGQRDAELDELADSGGVFLRSLDAVVVNWENVSDARPIKIVRHELAHLLVRQIVGEVALPMWVDEGLAALAERDLGETLRERYVARSLVTDGRLSLAALALSSDWQALGQAHSGAHYEIAAEAARALRVELAGPGLLHLLKEAARLGSFESAYALLAGRPLGDFVAAFPARLAQDLPAYRVDVAPAVGAGAVWTLLGFGADETVSVVIEGPQYRAAFDVSVDRHGAYSAAFGSTAPRGTYRLLARSGSQLVRGVISN